MTVKLTLSVDEAVIKKAKKYSRKTGKSISKLVENYLKSLEDKEEQAPVAKNVSPLIKKLSGIIKVKDVNPSNYKDIVAQELEKKYRQ